MTRSLVTVCMADVMPESVRWLWHHRIPRGKVTAIEGDPDTGKTTILLDIAARVSTGTPMPDGAPVDVGNVIICTAEDGLNDTIRPRLQAAGADLKRIRAIRSRLCEDGETDVCLPDDIDALREEIDALEATLVMIDPLSAYLSDQVDSWKDHSVRRALSPLARVAEETTAAVVFIRHLTKGRSGPALYRGGGSIGIVGAARSALLVARDPEEPETRRVVASVKNNLCPRPRSLRYSLEGTTVSGDSGDIDTSRVRWLGESPLTADALLAAADPENGDDTVVGDAAAFLKHELQAGRRAVKELFAAARSTGIDASDRTMRRAKGNLGIKSEREGFGPASVVYWYLPGHYGPNGGVQPPQPSVEQASSHTGQGGGVKAVDSHTGQSRNNGRNAFTVARLGVRWEESELVDVSVEQMAIDAYARRNGPRA